MFCPATACESTTSRVLDPRFSPVRGFAWGVKRAFLNFGRRFPKPDPAFPRVGKRLPRFAEPFPRFGKPFPRFKKSFPRLGNGFLAVTSLGPRFRRAFPNLGNRAARLGNPCLNLGSDSPR